MLFRYAVQARLQADLAALESAKSSNAAAASAELSAVTKQAQEEAEAAATQIAALQSELAEEVASRSALEEHFNRVVQQCSEHVQMAHSRYVQRQQWIKGQMYEMDSQIAAGAEELKEAGAVQAGSGGMDV